MLRDTAVEERLVGGDTDAVLHDGVDVLHGVQDGADALSDEAVLDGVPLAPHAGIGDVAKDRLDVGHLVGKCADLIGHVLTASRSEVLVNLRPLGAVILVDDRALEADECGLQVLEGVRCQAVHLELVDVHTCGREVSSHVRDHELGVVRGVDGGEVAVHPLHRIEESAAAARREAVLPVHSASDDGVLEADEDLLAVFLHHEDVGLVICARVAAFRYPCVTELRPRLGRERQNLSEVLGLCRVCAQEAEQRLADLIALRAQDGVLVLAEDVGHQIGCVPRATKSATVLTTTGTEAARGGLAREAVLLRIGVRVGYPP